MASSFKATFKCAGMELNILDAHYSLHQEVHALTGKASSVVIGGQITLTVESSEKTDLFEWMMNSFETKDGSIVYLKDSQEQTLKELKFKKGYLVKFEENFHASNPLPTTITITISSEEITMGNSTHKNKWV